MEELATRIDAHAVLDNRVIKWGTDQKALYVKPKVNSYIKTKYFAEYLCALVVTLFLLPFLGIIALMIKLDSKGDVIFKQVRYGLSGMPFYIYKFRTMVEGAHQMQDELHHLNEMEGGKLFKSDNDPRVTRFGRFLRKTSIDELPQLFNILKGDMTIIGPRPLSTPLNEYKTEELIRFRVRPGLGCIWQAYHRKETDFKNWMKTDGLYVQTISASLDVKLFWAIAKSVLLGRGAR